MDISANYDTYLEYLYKYIDLFRIELAKQGYNEEISDYEIESNWMRCDIELAVKELIEKNKI